MTDTLYIRIRIASGQFRWFAFTVRDRKAVLKEYRIMRHAGKARRSIARMHVVCLLFATVGGDCLPVAAKTADDGVEARRRDLQVVLDAIRPPPPKPPAGRPSTSGSETKEGARR